MNEPSQSCKLVIPFFVNLQGLLNIAQSIFEVCDSQFLFGLLTKTEAILKRVLAIH